MVSHQSFCFDHAAIRLHFAPNAGYHRIHVYVVDSLVLNPSFHATCPTTTKVKNAAQCKQKRNIVSIHSSIIAKIRPLPIAFE